MVEELDGRCDKKEREEASYNCLVGHPQMVLVEPHGVVEPLSEVRLAPARLLVKPAQVCDRSLGQALGACCVFSCIAKA